MPSSTDAIDAWSLVQRMRTAVCSINNCNVITLSSAAGLMMKIIDSIATQRIIS